MNPRWFACGIVLFILLTLWHVKSTRIPSIPTTRSSFDWATVGPHYRTALQTTLPTGAPIPLPNVQHKFGRIRASHAARQQERRNAVHQGFAKCWQSYKDFAWTHDELLPISGGSKDNYGGWAATLIDSLDTLWIMNMKEDFNDACRAVATLDWNTTSATACNVFETTIRHLGGLLSAYDLSQQPVLLDKAIELGDLLYTAFDTPNGMPPFWLDFSKARAGQLVAGDHDPSAASATLSMEFTRLSQLTGDNKYFDAITRVTVLMKKAQDKTALPGMWPAFWNLRSEDLVSGNQFTLGALSDSVYEYLPKMYALLGGLDQTYSDMYKDAAATIRDNLLFRPMIPRMDNILFSGTAWADDRNVRLDPEGQHLACFVGGMYGLGGKLLALPEHVELGLRLTEGCVYAYRAFTAGIMPEYFSMSTCPTLESCNWDEQKWQQDLAADELGHSELPAGFKNARGPSYILRPEAIESVFLLYRMTGREELLEAAWEMFQAIQKATSTDYCNAAIDDVTSHRPKQLDSMESFWLAETLKYFYLIFSPPDVINLDEWVLNTEAHPFRRPK